MVRPSSAYTTGGTTYKPHIDHVTLREKRFDYDVTRFGHQFAGVLCFQNALHEGRSTQAILHRCMWTPEVQESIATDTFPDYARRNGVSSYTVDLEQGDLYFYQHPPHPRGAGRGGRPAAHRTGHLHRLLPRRPGSLRLVVMWCAVVSCTIVQLYTDERYGILTAWPINSESTMS